ncbi:MAG: aromatic amino acid transport family protein [Candidatus Spechtbacterales bacterium]
MKALGSSTVLRAGALLAGSIIGVGIFGVPYVFSVAGVAPSVVLFGVVAVGVLLLHLMYGEIVERTGEHFRLAGYANTFFGRKAKVFSTTSIVMGGFAALIAYILVAADFLHILFGDIFGGSFGWVVIFWAVMTLGVAAGLRAIARVDILLTAALIVMLGAIAAVAAPHIEPVNLQTASWGKMLVPYGVILFALIGIPAIPEVSSAIINRGRLFPVAIVVGTLVPALITLVFALAVVGVSGEATSPDAISGLRAFVGDNLVYVGAAVGLVAIVTSFLLFAINLKETLVYDWRMNELAALLVTMGVPLMFIVLGMRNFIDAIAVAGAVFGAVDGTTIVLLHTRVRHLKHAKTKFALRLPKVVYAVLIVGLLLGGLYQLAMLAIF